MTISIEKGVPIPRSSYRRYPWSDMEVGDRVRVQGKGNGIQLAVQANITYAPKIFQARTIDGVSWVWRVK